MKKQLYMFGLLAAAAAAPGATFSGGGGQGTSIVDANGTGDYTTLRAAADDFSSFSGGCTGPWTLLIRSDLNETSSSVFGNATNGHTVTVKPATGVSPTVTFGYYAKPGGVWWDGGLLIGPKAQDTNTDFMDTDNFIVDGSNTVGGTSRDLKFVNTPPSGAEVPRIVVRVVGQCDNVVFKNCTIESVTTGTGDNIGVDFTARRDANTISHVPNNNRVENCEIKVPLGNIGLGVRCTNSGVPSGTAMTGIEVVNNDITASYRAVHYNMNAGGKIDSNRIRINQTAANRPQAVWHQSPNGTLNWTLDITGNRFLDVQTLDGGGWLFGIGVGAGVTTVDGATYNIINNTMAGFRYDYTGTTDPTASTWICRGISVETAGSGAIYNIYNNSINLPDIARFGPGADSNNRLGAISLLSAGSFAGTLNIQNNIFRYAQSNGTILSLRPSSGTVGGTLNINNNTYFAAGNVAQHNTTSYVTLADWQATGRDLASNVSDPTMPAGAGLGKWVSDTDLHWDAAPGSTYDGVSLSAVTTDMDGEARPSTPTKGADEFVTTSGVSDWMMFQ